MPLSLDLTHLLLARRLSIAHVIAPCLLPRLLRALPSQPSRQAACRDWLHEIKHDGFRMLVRRDKTGVRLFTRNGHDWTGRFPLIARAALSLEVASCLIDGEAVACDENGLPVFDRLRGRRDDRLVFLYAFDSMASEFFTDDKVTLRPRLMPSPI
jgi:ATP-dependent DNA ligase